MRLGISHVMKHSSPTQWAEDLRKIGCSASSFPVNYTASASLIDQYVEAAKAYDICIAEVGVWNSPHVSTKEEAEKNYKFCEGQLKLADYVKAKCCVNVSGGVQTQPWFFVSKENYSRETYERNIEVIQRLLDSVKPTNTYYVLEIMQWMLPTTPEEYLQFIKDVNRHRLAVHMDVVNLINNPYIYTHHNETIDHAFELLGPKIKSCHMKDCKLSIGMSVCINEVPCGEGVVDIMHYARKIDELDPEMPLLLEHLYRDEEFVETITRYIPKFEAAGIKLK